MSLFDPLYQIDSDVPPSLQEIQKIFAEFDGSGSGLMSARQMLAACQAISNIGFNVDELKNYVKEGLDVAGDDNGRIKMNEFASYLAFEANKRYKKKKKKKNNPPTANNGTQPQPSTDYSNPFADFMSGPSTNTNPNPNQQQSTQNNVKIKITPSPNGTDVVVDPKDKDMSSSYSPTEQNPMDMPTWFGHSQKTIQNHPNQPSGHNMDDPFALFGNNDDNKTNSITNGSNTKPGHSSVNTQDIKFKDDNNNNDDINVQSNLSPKYVKKNKSKHAKALSTSTAGLIAPPRAKGDKKSPKKKTLKKYSSTSGVHTVSASFSFADHFSDDIPANNNNNNNVQSKTDDDIKKKKKKKKGKYGKDNLKFRNAFSAAQPIVTHQLTPRKNKKKRNKIDAIVEMKRGTAMLKYGRRGFPHFRRFQVSHDLTKLLWYSRKKSLQETHVSVPAMRDILEGQKTDVFKQCTQKTLEKASFSILHGPKMKSLDIVAKSAEEAQLWIKGLKGLIKANQQGKLHKVVQIFVDVDFKDISKTKYRQCTDDERRKYEIQHKNRPELVHTITTTLQHSKKIFASLSKISQTNNVLNSNEFENIQLLTSEIENRLEEIDYGLTNKTADLTDLKRDVWVLKVDVTVLEEKAKVLSKIKTAIPI